MMEKKLDQYLYERGYKDGYAKGYSDGRFCAEDNAIKFYYCESNDKYYIGKRCDTMYYAEVMVYPQGDVCLNYVMSRFLPWGENIDDYKYESEPKEISFEKWVEHFVMNVRRVSDMKK